MRLPRIDRVPVAIRCAAPPPPQPQLTSAGPLALAIRFALTRWLMLKAEYLYYKGKA